MSQEQITLVKERTFDTIHAAVNKMVDMIKPTYGPASNKVVISKQLYKMVVDDGVQIARDFELEDPAENAVVNVIREVAVKTNDRVGDGTTSSLIMLQAIINEIYRRGGHRNGHEVEKELKAAAQEVKGLLSKQAKNIKTKEELKKVARVSYDNEEIAEMIADLYWKMGPDATITIDKSTTRSTYVETAKGITINNGYLSPYMITNPERMEAVLENPYILLTDYRLTEANDILSIMNKLAAANIRELVVIAENMEQSALATAVLNKVQGKFCLIAINAPAENRKIALEDIALMTGAHLFTESKGDKLEEAEISDLGRATRFISKRTESVIVGPKGKKSDVNHALTQLKDAIANELDEVKKQELLRRLSFMKNTVAVIKVGASTENEQKALKYKVEDAVNAVKVAYKHGVVCGAGLSLARLKTSSPLLNEALKYPHRQLRQNMGLETESNLKEDQALNVVTGKVGKFMEVGVVDPVEVLIAGVESAVSIASILVTCSGMIIETPKSLKTE